MSNPLVDPAGILNRALAIYREHAAVLFPAALIVSLLSAIFFFAREDAPVVALIVAVPMLIALDLLPGGRRRGRRRRPGRPGRAGRRRAPAQRGPDRAPAPARDGPVRHRGPGSATCC